MLAAIVAMVSAFQKVPTRSDQPHIPPLSARLELEIPWKALTISPEIVFNARQSRVFRDEVPTAASAIANLSATYVFGARHSTHIIALRADNLTNQEYRRHSSLIKDLAPEMGRGVRLTYSIKFF